MTEQTDAATAKIINGAREEKPNNDSNIKVLRQVIPGINGSKIIWTTSGGMFLGLMDFTMASPDAMKIIADDFVVFTAQQNQKVAPAPAGALAAIDASRKR